MKKELFFWISKDKSTAAGPVWIDVPENEADRKELDARKARLMENPIAYQELVDLKSMGFTRLHSASLNQFDGFDGNEKIGGSE